MLPRRFYLDNIFDDFKGEMKAMKCDIYEEGNKYCILADIPGAKKENIVINYDNGYLTISVSKKQEEKKEEKNYIRQERFYGNIERKFYVGDVSEHEIEAEFNDGVLKITVPKENQEQAKKLIEIK